MRDHRDLVIEDLAAEAAALEARLIESAQTAESYRALVNVALTQVATMTAKMARQTNTIKRLMGDTSDAWHPPIKLEPQQDVDIQAGMVRANEIRWTPFDGG